jgi:hypothetical protein
MTLTRFLTAYVYNPLVLALTRRQLERGRPAFGGKNATIGSFALLLAFPTMLTMVLSGLWHGAGYLFIIWGALHGVYLCINHAWRVWGPKMLKERSRYALAIQPVGFLLTFVAVVGAMVFFRSTTMSAATNLISGMVGLNGIKFPASIYDRLGPLQGALGAVGIGVETLWSASDFLTIVAWVVALLFIALALPNTLQILARYEPALGIKLNLDEKIPRLQWIIQWSASPVWAVTVAVMAAITILRLAGPSEFLYWQF